MDPHLSLDPDDYEDVDIDDPDNPELTEEDFARARPFKEVFPELYEAIMRAEVAGEPIVAVAVPDDAPSCEDEPVRKASDRPFSPRAAAGAVRSSSR